MIKLYQLKRTWGIPNLCHFCCKIESYLRMADIEYEFFPTLPPTAPKGKLPYIEDDGVALGDSRFIIEHLKTKYKDLDASLSDADRALSLAIQRLIEEHLYWVTMYSRWQYTDENWQTNKQAIFGGMPPVIRDVGAAYFRRKIKQQIYGHGTGRHQAEEIFSLGKQDIDALSELLGDKPYFLGDQPSIVDTTAFGFLINTIGCPIESPVKEHGLTKDNLKQYVARIQSTYYSDLKPA